MLLAHAQHENENIHPLLEKKESKVHLHAYTDHDEMDEKLVYLQNLLKQIDRSPDRVEAGDQFYLEYRKFVGDNLFHLHEEETKILPELQRLYSDKELRHVDFPVYEQMTVEQMIQMLSILFPHMNFFDKQALMTDIKLSQPEKFAQILKQVNQFLTEEEQARFACLKGG